MCRIVVPVSSLHKLIKELRADKMDYVELSILEPDEEEGDPACLFPSGFNSSDLDMQVDYDTIDHVPDFD